MHRQLNHWKNAIERLAQLPSLISQAGWVGIEGQTRQRIRQALTQSVGRLQAEAQQLTLWAGKQGGNEVALHQPLKRLRRRYLLAEETIHFYADAINTRTNAEMGLLLSGLDALCVRSMQELLEPLQKPVPKVLIYVDKGLGASVLKSDMKLWDGTISPVAAVKVTFHNLPRPTASIHETGHQVAAILDWNRQLAQGLYQCFAKTNPALAKVLASWSSEIAADAFAFVHTGYAAVASLHDVLAGEDELVFGYHAGDPHPIAHLRILMNIEMCRQFYGKGPWNDLERVFKVLYPLSRAPEESRRVIQGLSPHLNKIVTCILRQSYAAFRQKSLVELIPPERVSPRSLQQLSNNQLYTNKQLMEKESLRVLAKNGYDIATCQYDPTQIYAKQKQWLLALGKQYLLTNK